MKNSPAIKISLAAVGVMIVAWLILSLTSGTETKTEAARTDGNKNRCSKCGRPISRTAQAAGECPYCALEEGPGRLEKKRQKSLATSPIVAVVLVALFAVLLATHLGLFVRSRVGKNTEEVLYYYHCPKCHRKLRYRDGQIGKMSQCPICKRPFMFPKPEEEPKEPFFRALSGRLRQFFSFRQSKG